MRLAGARLLLLHTLVHIPEPFFDRPGSFIYRYYQEKDELVSQINKDGKKEVFHKAKIRQGVIYRPVFDCRLPIFRLKSNGRIHFIPGGTLKFKTRGREGFG
jgi:hypothetical protein